MRNVSFINQKFKLRKILVKVTKKPKGHEAVKFAKSVDLSGDGDPCSFAGKDYVFNWTYAKKTDRIHFTLETPVKENRWWSAVGIGRWL